MKLNMTTHKVYSAFHPSGVVKWVPAAAGKAKAGMAHSDCGWTFGCAGKTVISLENTCHTWALLRWWFTTKRRYIKCMHLYLYTQVKKITSLAEMYNRTVRLCIGIQKILAWKGRACRRLWSFPCFISKLYWRGLVHQHRLPSPVNAGERFANVDNDQQLQQHRTLKSNLHAIYVVRNFTGTTQNVQYKQWHSILGNERFETYQWNLV